MDTPSPEPGKQPHQRRSLTPELTNDSIIERASRNGHSSAPNTPHSDIEHEQAIERALEDVRSDEALSKRNSTQLEGTPNKVEKRTRFAELPPPVSQPIPPPRSEPGHRPSRGRANAYAKKLAQKNVTLQRVRHTLSQLRSELAHKEEVVQTKQEFVQESLNLVVGMLLAPTMAATMTETNSLLATLQADAEFHREQLMKLAKLREEVMRLESSAVLHETQFDKNLAHFLNNAINEDEEELSDISNESTADVEPEEVAPAAPGEVDVFLDRWGDRRIIIEQMAELEAEHKDEMSRREILSEQDTPIADVDARKTDQTYSARREELDDALEQAENQIVEAYEKCIAKGFEPERYMTDVRLGEPNDASVASQEPAVDSSAADSVLFSTEPTTVSADTGLVPWMQKQHHFMDDLVASALPSGMDIKLMTEVDSLRTASASPAETDKVNEWLADQRLHTDDTIRSMPDEVESPVQPLPCVDDMDNMDDIELRDDDFAAEQEALERREHAVDAALKIMADLPVE